MVMMEQSKRLSEPLRWTRAGRIAVLATGACVLAAVVVLAAVALTSAPRDRAGCIDLTFPSSLGGANVYACGQRAREQCASPRTIPLPALTVARACRRAGLPVGA
ncbi:MAG TPA: hypothetical protein VFV03_05150 [Solirubrobacteraceae bacterium]|nr:hypothetical protein [Solirubrobacteraceae bacterium]